MIRRIGRAHAMLLRSFSAVAPAVGSAMSAYGQTRLPPRAGFLSPVARSPVVGRIRHLLGKNGFALALCAIVLLAAGLRVYRLDYQSLWRATKVRSA